MLDQIKNAVHDRKNDWVSFCRKLIQTPSPTYAEDKVAHLCMDEMKKLVYDDVWRDEKGNVIAIVEGSDPDAPVINCNSHLDQVAEGDENDWRFPPFSAHIEDGRIYGRGASDTKGAIAVQVYAPSILTGLGQRPRSTVIVTLVVEEELSGQGTKYLLENSDLGFDLCILGEATSNNIMLGHRGCVSTWVNILGTSAHASMPEKGRNPNYDAARFMLRLEEEQTRLKAHPELGRSTLTPTIYDTGQISRNTIPDRVRLYIDVRNACEESDDIRDILEKIARDLSIDIEIEQVRDIEGNVKVSNGFATPPEHGYVVQTQKIVTETLGRDVKLGHWRFCTDGRLTSAAGIPTIGFSPCEEHLAHTIDDSVSIQLMEESLCCYPRLFTDMSRVCGCKTPDHHT